jgi:hypothetical protein
MMGGAPTAEASGRPRRLHACRRAATAEGLDLATATALLRAGMIGSIPTLRM